MAEKDAEAIPAAPNAPPLLIKRNARIAYPFLSGGHGLSTPERYRVLSPAQAVGAERRETGCLRGSNETKRSGNALLCGVALLTLSRAGGRKSIRAYRRRPPAHLKRPELPTRHASLLAGRYTSNPMLASSTAPPIFLLAAEKEIPVSEIGMKIEEA